MHSLKLYTNAEFSPLPQYLVMGADIIGLHGFFYRLVQHDGVVFALKLINEDMFLPEDEDDMLNFLSGSTIDQLLSYVEQLLMARDQLKQGVKRQRRRAHNVKTTTSARVTFSPPAPIAGFPQATFYTPKRSDLLKPLNKTHSISSHVQHLVQRQQLNKLSLQ